MSRFHVEAVMNEFPELLGILGKKKVAALHYAKVSRINTELLMASGFNTPHYIISHDGLLLAKVETTTFREMCSLFFRKNETVLDAVRRCGPVNVAYIAQYDSGCDDVGAPCALYIYKAPKDEGLPHLIRTLREKSEKEITA